ncbi:MAG: lysyl-tRNA synthetase [Microgenomates group bacterium GW2011_GWA2_46_7]|nr:MAG: lysyl-tRNA synthetase [Microgenomates group bacterium GW2011_GWA2_46_7]
MTSRLEEIRNERIIKLNKLVSLGISPYPAQSHKEVSNGEVITNYAQYAGKTLSLTGRLRALREHGKLAFGDLEDQSGKIQLLFRESKLVSLDKKKGTLGFAELSLIDVGDFIAVKGLVCKSKTGAISLDVQELTLLTKSIRPLPDSWDGLKDPDTIFRRRYLDLVMNPSHRELFSRKSKFWSVARQFMTNNGFVEVETPVLEHVTGGADARPFNTHHNALDETFYMRISTELYLKRLIGGGFEKIYTLGPNFRNEGIDDEHLQEYYQLEWYWAYADFRDNMELTKSLFQTLAKEVYGTTKFTRSVHTFDLAGKWEEIDYGVAILNKLGIDIFHTTEAKMATVLMKHGVKLDGKVGKSRLVDNLWKIVRADIAGPAFLINTPKFISPLAKSYANNPEITERFQIILAGSELCNGYSELNDPMDQLARFKEQQSARDAGDDEAQMLDIDYVEMLEYGMPPTSGLGVSERLFWFLENVTAREGTLFPQMKRHIGELTRRIYNLNEMESKKDKKGKK